MIYLDNAATTLEKPPSVAKAISYAITHYASPGRGGYPAAMRAGELMYQCRETASSMFDVPNLEQVVLTASATHGLNIAIRTLVEPGDTVLISGYEHNAVTRSLHAIPEVTVKIVNAPLFDTEGAYAAFEQMLTQDVDVVIYNHVSNAFGFIQPMDRIARLCRQRNKPLIVDAAQSAGMVPVSLARWGAAFVAMPGHKGLYGPQGTGLLLCGEQPRPILYGGTGSLSIQQEMPDFLPDRLEAGTPNVCGAAGLLAGMRHVQRLGVENVGRRERRLCRHMMDLLAAIPGVRIFRGEKSQIGLFSFLIAGKDCETVSQQLGEAGVAVRAGLHCAPLAHQTAGTLESGTVRASFSIFNRSDQIERAADLICAIAKNKRAS